MKKPTGIFLFFLIPIILSANPVRKARIAMEKYDYSQAIELLRKAVEKEKFHNAAVPLLADCYRMQRDILNAKAWYAEAVNIPEAAPETFLYYAQMLQATGEYSRARLMYMTYSQKSATENELKFVAHCDSVLGPWRNLQPSAEISNVQNINTSQSDFGAAFHEGYLVFASDFINQAVGANPYGWTGNGYLDIKRSKPAEKGVYTEKLGKPQSFSMKLNQPYHEGPACFSPDGNTIYFTRAYKDNANRKDGIKTNLLKIFIAKHTSVGWSNPQPFRFNSKEYSVGHPAVSPDGKYLYFASDMPGGQGGTDIWRSSIDKDSIGMPVNLGNVINTADNEMFPYISDDGSLYFASEGHPGYGALDLFCAEKHGESWTTPVNLKTPLNSSFDDFAIAFAPGTKSGYFSSNRPGGMGNDDIYFFRMIELPPPQVPVLPERPKQEYITGVIRDKVSLEPIEGATAFILHPKTGTITTVKTGPDGKYQLPVDDADEYVVKGMKPAYIADCLNIAVQTSDNDTMNKATRDLLLDKLAIKRTFRIENIYYDFDKYNIRADAKPELDKLVTIMNENPINVELGSHTDSRGSVSYNDKLSQNRANSAVEYIISQGIDKSRITAKGYGEHQLTNKCSDGVNCTEEEHQANRRTEFKITEYSSPEQQAGQFNPDAFSNGMKMNIKALPDDFFKPCK